MMVYIHIYELSGENSTWKQICRLCHNHVIVFQLTSIHVSGNQLIRHQRCAKSNSYCVNNNEKNKYCTFDITHNII